MILKKVLETKTVSVWGLGYLGYTTMLMLQDSGFHIVAYDLNVRSKRLYQGGRLPGREHVAAWTRMGYLPRLERGRVTIAKSPSEMARASHLHFIAMPEDLTIGIVEKLAAIFSQALKHTRTAHLIVFESAFIPWHIEKNFVEKLREKKLLCGRDYFLGAWFRTDWTVERFIGRQDRMPIAGYCRKSAEEMRELFSYLGLTTVELDGLTEAEVYINSTNAIQAMADDFVRQLALGYPSVRMKKLSQQLFENIVLDDCDLTMGTGATKMTYAIDHLTQGSANPGNLTLLKEFQGINISSVLTYAEYIERHGYKSVAILGLTYKGNQKDLTLSPAITLANCLVKKSIRVMLTDPLLTKGEMRGLVPGAEATEFPDRVFSADVLVLSSDHTEYKCFSQNALDRIRKNTKLIIDNYGIWSHFSFGDRIQYHQVGDGSLDLLK